MRTIVKKHASHFGSIDSLKERTVLVLIFFITFFVYFPGLTNDFVYDDFIVIKQEAETISLQGIASVFSEPHYPYLPYYRPVTRLSFIVQKTFFSDSNAFSYHMVNIFFAGLLGCFVYKLFCLLFPNSSRFLLFLSTLLFILHPVTSSIVYPAASGRETLLPVLFMVMSLYSFLHRRLKHYLLSILCYALALFGKEQAVMFPFILLLADVTVTGTKKIPHMYRLTTKHAPFFLLTLFYFLIRLQVFQGQEFVLNNKYVEIAIVPIYALQQIFLPYKELHYEPMNISSWFSISKVIFIMSIVLYIAFHLRKQWQIQKKRVMFFLGVCIIGLLPNANIVRQEVLFDERYIVFSMLGIIGLITTALMTVRIEKQKTLSIILCTVIIILGFMTIGRAGYFKNNYVFASQWVKTNPDYFLPHYNLARSQEEHEEYAQAIESYKKSLSRNPSWSPSYLNLGSLYMSQGKFNEALSMFNNYVLLEPASAKGYYHLGLLFLQTEHLDDAEKQFLKAIALDPGFPEAHNNLGVVYDLQGNSKKAKENYLRAIELDPENVSFQENLQSLQEKAK